MAENKKSFVLYCDLLKSIEHLTNEEKGILLTHMLEYVNDKNPVLKDRLILTAWKPIELQLKRDLRKFEEVKLKRSDAGKKSAGLRALKTDEQTATNPTRVEKGSTKSTSVESVEHRSTNPTVNDTVNDTVNVNDTVTVTDISNTADDKNIFIEPNILETQNSTLEKIDSGKPSSFPALGHQPDRSYISNEYQTVKNTNVENAKSLLSDQHGKQRDAFMLAIGKNDIELFRYFLREFNAHRSRNGKEDESLNEYAKHLNNWISKKGTDGIKTMTIAYNQIKNPITTPKYGHYLYDK